MMMMMMMNKYLEVLEVDDIKHQSMIDKTSD